MGPDFLLHPLTLCFIHSLYLRLSPTCSFSAIRKDANLRTTWEKKMAQKEALKKVREEKKALREAAAEEAEQRKKRAAEKRQRKLENEQRAQVVQTVRNSSTLLIG